MKILLTGANGLLGQKVIDRAEGYDISLIATGKGPYRGKKNPNLNYRELDITNKDELLNVLKQEEPDVVIHAAAMTNVDACETAREDAWNINVTATKNLAIFCNELNIHLVHISTDFIFDGTAGPYDETAIPAPLSYYGETKLEAERAVQENCKSWAILRTVLVYGVTPGMSRSNIVLWARNALMEGKKINVVTDQFRSPTLAEDLADASLIAATKEAQGIFHISGPEMMSIYELVNRVAKFYNLDNNLISPSTSENLNQPAKRPPVTGFIIEKAKKELGYKPHSFEEGLQIVKDQLAM